eukprot:scaffold127517_cov33-Phaeocystis_antarctica.AAC.1
MFGSGVKVEIGAGNSSAELSLVARPVLIATLAERSSSKYLPCRRVGDVWYGVGLRLACGWRAGGMRVACGRREGGGAG